MMKRLRILPIVFALVVQFVSVKFAFGQEAGNMQGAAAPQLPLHLVSNFFKYPATYVLGEVIGVAVNAKGHIFLLNRGYHPLLEFNPDGSFVRSMGEGSGEFEGAHSIRFDPQDNMWYIDAASNMVIKFDTQGRTEEVLGMRPEPWTWATHVIEHAVPSKVAFYQPTDVTWGADGSVFISDGYGNSRIVKFDKEGNYVKQWGERGTGKGDFNTPHSIVIDKNQTLYVADRANNRIQTFDTDGNLKQVWTGLPGPPWSFCITPGPNQVIYVGSVGKIYKLDLTGKVLGVLGHYGRTPGTMDWVHAVACPDEKTVYVSEEQAWRLDKYVEQ
ncbi:MAG: peptidyl-alpha-hydroxyglycine alpha-amidating lyase family protein [Acidobacteriia bacterium]|nr:peptidyl-alpha-hydroxyglycine alpha-amidating lyase family protein [Terriglobia bacterium]